MRVRFIVNPKAGTGTNGALAAAIMNGAREELLGMRGLFEIKVSTSRQDAFRLSREAADKEYDGVFACGGDGTVNTVASALVGTKTVLGIVPAGSGNGLAHALGIPQEVQKAVSVISTGHVLSMDVGTACGKYFFSTAGVGLDAAVSKEYGKWTGGGGRRGVLPYLPIVLMEYFMAEPERVTVRWDGDVFMGNPLILTVANTREYGGGAVIAPEAEPFDGLLDICMVEKAGWLKDATLAMRVFKGNLMASKQYRNIKARAVTVVRGSAGLVQLDGETFAAEAKISFGLLPQALRVWAF
ncbi:Transcription regulator [contains diacylglycerol kinase catalytic domain] [hydrothermal vent metagenome]|uniref:Transcription regulator [contains diacylglycerol kinase catalytic domain] n=1 Tax=hydrothermal vent metagenome TaxID=652676 RepID=A0A3B0V909_9ZZZZ